MSIEADKIIHIAKVLLMDSDGTPVSGSPGAVLELLLSSSSSSPKTGVPRQDDPVKVLLSSVTAPVCANARPSRSAPDASVIEVDERILPFKEVFVPSTAELTWRHHISHALPPTTLAVPDVISVDADLKIHTPDPLSVSVPDNSKASAQYTPATRFSPTKSLVPA